jgi:uncharacterized protein YqhQ
VASAHTAGTRFPSYGGQAVLEGVMMRGTRACAVAVRGPNQQIVVEEQDLPAAYRGPLGRLPLLRGLLSLWDSLGLGMRALAFSASVQAGEETPIQPAQMAATMVLSLAFGIGLFFVLPAAAAAGAERYLGLAIGWAHLIEGLIRLAILLGYLWAVGRIGEIQRVFAYHGAEHKTINAFEAGVPLNVESVSLQPRQHTRCGTSFLLTLVVLSVLLFSLLPPMSFGMRMASRIVAVPVLAMLAYEYIRFAARWSTKPWMRPLIAPNLALQGLTTREPDASMIEVALAAFSAMRERESASEAQAPTISGAARG